MVESTREKLERLFSLTYPVRFHHRGRSTLRILSTNEYLRLLRMVWTHPKQVRLWHSGDIQ